MANPVVHFEIIGKDVAALREFYRGAFDWQASVAPAAPPLTEYNFIENPSGISGGIGAAPEGYEGHATFYVHTSNIDEALEKIESLGGSRMMGPQQVPGGPKIALFRDPENHIVGLVQPD